MSERGPFAGFGGATDAYLGRFVLGTCGTPANTLVLAGDGDARLDAGFPVLGRPVTLELTGAEPFARGLLFLGTPAETPIELDGLGTLYLDPRTAVPFHEFTTDAAGATGFPFALPQSTELCGLELVVQGLVVGELTGGLALTLGG